MRHLVPLAILLLSTTINFAAASVIISTGPFFPGPTEEIDTASFDNVNFRIGSRGLYRPSGSQPWDRYGLERASVSMTLTSGLDAPLSALHYDGRDSMYAELTGYIHLSGRRDAPRSLDLPIHATVVFSPTAEGTDLFVKAIPRSGELPTRFDLSKSISGTARDETGKVILSASFSAKGAKSTYAFDYQEVVDQGTLRFLTEMTSTNPITSRALAVSQVRVGSQLYLTERPGERRPLSIYFSSNPIPEPSTFLSAVLAGICWVGRRRRRT